MPSLLGSRPACQAGNSQGVDRSLVGQGKDGLVQLVWELDGPGTQLAGRLFPISRGVAQPTTRCCGGGAGGSEPE